jgi:hypothetical protein
MNTRGLLDQLLKSGQDLMQQKTTGSTAGASAGGLAGSLGGLLGGAGKGGKGGDLGTLLKGAGGGALLLPSSMPCWVTRVRAKWAARR